MFSSALQCKSKTLTSTVVWACLHIIFFLLFALCYSSLLPIQGPALHPPLSCSCSWGLWDTAVRWRSWDVARSLIPTLWEMRLSCTPSCSRNFDQILMCLGSDPDMTGPATWKRSLEGKGWGYWRVLIWPVNPEKKGIILKVSFLCCCSALWVIKVSCIRFSLANIAIYNDLTFLFLKLAKRIMIWMLTVGLLKIRCSWEAGRGAFCFLENLSSSHFILHGRLMEISCH